YDAAIKILQDAIKIEPRFLDAYVNIAGMYQETRNYKLAIENYEAAKAIDSNYFKDFDLPLSISLAGIGEFEKALAAVNSFLSIGNLNEKSRKLGEFRKKTYEFAVGFAKQRPMGDYHFEPRNMGDSINSVESEYFPALTLDQDEFIFTRRLNGTN